MTSLALVGLVALIATSARLNRKDWSGQRPLLSALNVVIALYILYVLLPAILVAMNHGAICVGSRLRIGRRVS